MSLLENLNDNQKEAVLCCDQHLRIIAGAGSGKTRVVTTRIAYLIQELKVYPHKILAITFTNKAAKEMKERVQMLLPQTSAGIQISTIHSFCVRLLREDIQEIDYPKNFNVLDSDDQKSILKEAYKQFGLDVKSYSYGNMLGYISNHKTKLIDAQEAKNFTNGWKQEEVKAEVYAFYEKRLQEMKALDFDDLLIFAYRLLKGYPHIKEKWQRRFRYIHVDEFQDVDELQYHIIRFLVGEDTYLCVVGDPDQTIYTWRGAQVNFILDFERDYQGCKSVILNENYRSAPAILHGANALIKYNQNRIDKDLYTQNTNQDKIIHFTSNDEQGEPLWVSAKIKDLHRDGVAYRDIAILYRSNYLSRSLEKTFLEFSIPYRIYGGIRFYDRAEIKDALSYLRLLAPQDSADTKEKWKDLAIRRVINVPKRGVGAKTMEAIENYAAQEDINLYEALRCQPFGSSKVQHALSKFVHTIEKYRALVNEVCISQLLQQLLEEMGYLHNLQEEKEIERLENIQELLHDMEQFEQNDPEGGLHEYLQMISLYSDNEKEEAGDGVSLMSIHAAKGLEFDYVFVYNLCEGVFPNERAMNEGGQAALEEERRLAYVAFTRARKQLFLSDSHGYSHVLDKAKTASRFVKELPEEYVEEVGAKPKDSFSPTYTGAEFLAMNQESTSSLPVSSPTQTKKKGKLRKGDLIVHDAFGEGVIIKIEDGLAQIAFDKKYGIRKIVADHPSIMKK